MDESLMKYIPKAYKKDIVSIEKGRKVWNEHSKRWNIMIVVEWKDGAINEYQNASYMRVKLQEFGRN